MKYNCNKCGKEHEELPAISFNSPHYYHILSEDDKKNIVELSDDFCVIKHEDQTDYFIRAVLFQKIIDHSDTLDYGIWVSLSKKSFDEYKEHFKDENHTATFFGWFCSQIEGYEETLSLKANVHTRSGNERPEVVLENCNNDFVMDYYSGITIEEAEARVKKLK